MGWDTVISEPNDRLEILQVADGYLVRNWARQGDAAAYQVSLCFVAGTLPAAPTVVDAPAVMPLQAAPGDMLSCTTGNWQGVPLSYGYVWRRDGEAAGVFSLEANNYVVTEADDGAAIDCVVTATNAGGSTEATSNAVTIGAARARARR